MKPRLLDLFCGAGGAGKGYADAGFEVFGVDIKPQPNYPFEFVQMDALAYMREHAMWAPLGESFDAIHASPPCQAHTAMKTMPNARAHKDYLPDTRQLLEATGLPYVIENVVGAPMPNAVTICGASLGLGSATHHLARHRLFETNFPLMVPPCAHGSRPVVGFYGDHVRDARRVTGDPDKRLPDMDGGRDGKLKWGNDAMGIDWMTWAELVQAIPPAYTEHVGGFLMAEVRARALGRAA